MELVEGDWLTITVAPKGFGSENMTSLHMLKPSVTQETIEDTIVRAVSEAGSNPCPPVVGVGLGGDAELCAILAKKALLRPVDQHNEDPFYAEMEARILEKINRLGTALVGWAGRPPRWPWPSTPTPPIHCRSALSAVNSVPCDNDTQMKVL